MRRSQVFPLVVGLFFLTSCVPATQSSPEAGPPISPVMTALPQVDNLPLIATPMSKESFSSLMEWQYQNLPVRCRMPPSRLRIALMNNIQDGNVTTLEYAYVDERARTVTVLLPSTIPDLDNLARNAYMTPEEYLSHRQKILSIHGIFHGVGVNNENQTIPIQEIATFGNSRLYQDSYMLYPKLHLDVDGSDPNNPTKFEFEEPITEFLTYQWIKKNYGTSYLLFDYFSQNYYKDSIKFFSQILSSTGTTFEDWVNFKVDSNTPQIISTIDQGLHVIGLNNGVDSYNASNDFSRKTSIAFIVDGISKYRPFSMGGPEKLESAKYKILDSLSYYYYGVTNSSLDDIQKTIISNIFNQLLDSESLVP